MSSATVIAAFEAAYENMIVGDPAATEAIDMSALGVARVNVDSTGGKTIVLPDSGFMCLIHNYTGAGTITVNDTDGNAVASVVDEETGLCMRAGEATNKRWHAIVLKMNAN